MLAVFYSPDGSLQPVFPSCNILHLSPPVFPSRDIHHPPPPPPKIETNVTPNQYILRGGHGVKMTILMNYCR